MIVSLLDPNPHPTYCMHRKTRICASADPDIYRSCTTKSFSSCRFSWGENGSGWKSGAILGRRTNPQLEELARDGIINSTVTFRRDPRK